MSSSACFTVCAAFGVGQDLAGLPVCPLGCGAHDGFGLFHRAGQFLAVEDAVFLGLLAGLFGIPVEGVHLLLALVEHIVDGFEQELFQNERQNQQIEDRGDDVPDLKRNELKTISHDFSPKSSSDSCGKPALRVCG